jgi:predicted membrane protein DUF2238
VSTTRRRPAYAPLLGDWGPIVRDPIDVLRLTFLIGAIVLLALGEIGAGIRMALTFALVVLCRVLDPPRPFDLAFCLGMALQAWGNAVTLFATVPWYDKVVHFVLTFAAAPLFYLALVRLDAVPDLAQERPRRRRHVGIVVITLALGLAFGALYEVYEYFAVHALGTDLQIGYADTIGDLLYDAAAALAGGLLLVVWAVFGWTTTRRAPEAVVRRRTTYR